MSKVLSVAEVLASAEASLDALAGIRLELGDEAGARELARSVERLSRKVRVLQIDVVAEIDDHDLHVGDGHASARVMVEHVNHLSAPEAKRRDRARRMLADMPAVRAGLVAGRIGLCQIDRIALVFVNPRVSEKFVALDAQVAILAATLTYLEFDRRLRNWVRQVDEDGTADRARRCQENRRARLVQDFDGGWDLMGGFGSLSGAQMHAIHLAFVEAEFQADWHEAREIHGDATTLAHLARTHDQRDADAMTRIFEYAANAWAAAPGGAPIDTTIVMDHETFERELRRAAGADLEPRPDPGLGPLPDDHDHDHDRDRDRDDEPDERGQHPGRAFRCHTADGHPVDPTEAFANALTGRVRRMVVGWDGVVLDASGYHRLYTGTLRSAVMLLATSCYWPGCNVKVRHCQADHLDPRRNGARTNPGNGGPACGRHNRLKEHGYTARRDPRGRMHVHRPDGTEIE
jgi:hypothetical protein